MTKEQKFAIAAINFVEIQNKMAPPDMFGLKRSFVEPDFPAELLGCDAMHAIPVNDVFGEECYLSKLRDEETDAAVIFHRLGSDKGAKGIVDMFECVTTDAKKYFVLYLDPYYTEQSQRAPQGFKLAKYNVGLNGTSVGYNEDFPNVIRQVEEYSKRAYGADIASAALVSADMEILKKKVQEERTMGSHGESMR